MKNAEISVIVVNRDTKDLAKEALQSLFHNSDGLIKEVVFIDNGSKDGSAYAILKDFPEVKVVEEKENIGFSKAVNKAVYQCQDEYLFLLNPDTMVKPGTISKLYQFLMSHPEAGIVASNLIYPDGSPQPGGGVFPTLPRQIFQLSGLKVICPKCNKQDNAGANPRRLDWVLLAAALLRRKAWNDACGFDEDYFLYGEDMDFGYRLKKKRWQVYLLPDAVTLHHGNPGDTLRWGDFKERLIQENTLRFFKKHYGKFQACALRIVQQAAAVNRLIFWRAAGFFRLVPKDLSVLKINIHRSCFKNGM